MPWRRRAPGAPQPAHPVDSPQPVVLVIDDDQTVCMITERVLATLGFRSMSATDAADGVALFRTHLDEIVCTLLDVTMPGTGLAATLGELRAANPGAPVVLISGHDAREVAARVPEGSVSGVLQKPFDPEQLGSLLDRVMHP